MQILDKSVQDLPEQWAWRKAKIKVRAAAEVPLHIHVYIRILCEKENALLMAAQ